MAAPIDDQVGFVPDNAGKDYSFVPDPARADRFGFVPDSAVVVHQEARTPRLGDILAKTPTGKVLSSMASEAQYDLAPVARTLSRFSRAIPADVMAEVAGTPEYGGNIDAALTPARKVPATFAPGEPAPNGMPTLIRTPSHYEAPPQMPVDKAIDAAFEESKFRGEFPWASIAAKTSQGVFASAPKVALLAAVPQSLPAQMAASGALFSLDDNGQFHPEEVPFNTLLPGVGKLARATTGAAIGAAISKGATTLENPVAQKVLEEIGDQAGLNAFMLAQQSPQMVQLWKTDRPAFYQQLTTTLGQNLTMRLGLGGAGDFSPDKNSQTRNFIEANADLFTQRILSRAVSGDLARQLRTAPIENPGPVRQPIQEDTGSSAGFSAQVPVQPNKLDLSTGTIVPEQASAPAKGSVTEPAEPQHPAMPAVNKLADAVEELRAALSQPFKPGAPDAMGNPKPAEPEPKDDETGTIVPETQPLTESGPGETTGAGAAAETVTGQNERKGSEATAATNSAAEPMPAEGLTNSQKPPPPPKAGKNPFFLRPRSDGVPDILDAIQELGGIRRPSEFSGGEYDGFREAMVGPARMLIKSGAKHAPDTLIEELRSMGGVGNEGGTAWQRIETPDDLWDAIRAAVKGRDKLRSIEVGQRTEAKQTEQFQMRALDGNRPKKEAGTYTAVPVGKMLEGDVFKVQGNSFTVKHLEFDADNNLAFVEVKDGPKFGVQRVDGSEVIHVDKNSFEAGPNHDSGPPPELVPAIKPEIPKNNEVGGRTSGPAMELKEESPSEGPKFKVGEKLEHDGKVKTVTRLSFNPKYVVLDNKMVSVSETHPVTDALREDATPENLDKSALHFYGKRYAELSPEEKNEIRHATETESIPRRQQPGGTQRRQPADTRGESEKPAPDESAASPVRSAPAKTGAADREALAQEVFGSSYKDLFPESQQYVQEQLAAGRKPGEKLSDPIEVRLRQLQDDRAKLTKTIKWDVSKTDSIGTYPVGRAGVGALARMRYIDGQINLLREIARAPEDVKAKWFKKLLEEDDRDAVQRTLDKLISATKPKTGLQTGEVSMGLAKLPVWLTQETVHGALKIVRAAYTGGKRLAEAIQEGVAWLRAQNIKGFDEDEAHVFLLKAMKEDEAEQREPATGAGDKAKPYDDIQKKVQEAADKLKQAVRMNSSKEARVNASKTRAEARAEMSLAGAQYHKQRAELLSHPDYIRDLIEQHDAALKEYNAAKDRGDNTDELGRNVERLQDELNEVPAKLRKGIAKDLVNKGKPTDAEAAAKSGAPDLPVSAKRAAPADEEVGKDPAVDRLKRTVAELPARARDFFSDVREVRRKIGAKIATMPNRDIVAFTKGAADNRAMIAGKETSNFILHALNRAFGHSGDNIDARNQLREHALTFVVESGRDRATLQQFRNTIEASQHRYSTWAKRALDAIAYADRHWDRFQEVAETYEKFTDAEVAAENQSGITTPKISGGYVFHLQDAMENWALPDIGTAGGGGASAPFKHIRDHATYADALANGVNPKTLNAVDLLQRRVALGRKLINYRAWIDSMRRMIDPATQLPIVTDKVVRMRPDGTQDVTAPPGYGIGEFAGQRMAVHKGYDGLFSALTGESWFSRGTLRPMTMELATTSKHLQLAFDTYHLGRMAFWNSMVRAATEGGPGMFLPGNPFSHKRGLTLLDNTPADIHAMAERGEIPKAWADDLVEQKRRIGVLVDAGYNVGHSADNIYSHWIEKLPIAGRFNHWLFQKYVRGAMAESGLIELARQQKMHPELSEAQVARNVARDLNKRFGNLNNESWIKSGTGKDLARMIILAPSWNEGLVRSEMGAVRQLAMAPVQSLKAKRLVIGTLGRATASAVLGQFIANQVLNYATRGHPTWQNKEEGSGSKLSAYIPDVVGNGPGFFLNPLTLPMEMSDLLLKKTERTGDFTKALRETAMSRLNTVGKSGAVFVTREDQSGAKLRTGGDVTKEMLSSLVPMPLSAGAGARAVKQLATGEHEEKFPGQFQRQAFQTFGVKLESAPSDEQRIKALAQDYDRQQGITPSADFYHSDYYDLDRAILIGNQRETQTELADLLEKKTKNDIKKHYNRYMRAPYTGNTKRESDFKATLNPEQLETYGRAQARREQVRNRVTQALDSIPATDASAEQ